MRPAHKIEVSEHYKYTIISTDDVLAVRNNGDNVLWYRIGGYFKLKEESIGPPKIYSGGHALKVELENGVKAWAFRSSQYVRAVVKNVDDYLKGYDGKFPFKAETTIRARYSPEIDVLP